jgi:molybdate transport system substrate-binding protein
MSVRAALAALVALVIPVAGCSSGSKPEGLTVGAGSSLRSALAESGPTDDGTPVRFSFAGSDLIAAQIQQGVDIDVFAAADDELTELLEREGLVGEPVEFAGNRLVIGVPVDSAIDSVQDLASDGVDVVVGDPSVPVGAYAREMIGRLAPDVRDGVLANVRSEEQDATSTAAKLTQGAADAAILYASDLESVEDEIRAVPVPDGLQPRIAYSAAVVEGTNEPEAAREFIESLVSGERARLLRDAGLLPPPE